jgi:glycosyltransferase involved in cell wall biosynthesis
MGPKISVIIPTYYRNDLLPEAIESVAEQEYEPVELVVVDDSGEGNAKPVLEEYGDVVDKPILKDENGGWAGAYTTGIGAATGEYIQFLDDDDYLLDGKLRKCAEVLQDNPDVGVSYCGAIRGDDGCIRPKPEVSGDILEQAMRFRTFPLWTASMLMEREVLEDCLPLAGMGEDDNLDIELGDTDLKIELAKRTKFNYVDECLVYYRQEENMLWTGTRKLKKVRQNVQHRRDLYEQHPAVKRELLAHWYERGGKRVLQDRLWSLTATQYFLKATYYADDDKLAKSIETCASVLGRPGLVTAQRARTAIMGSGLS